MKRLNVIQPYDDDKLVWNKTTGQYELTFEYCKENFDLTFADDDVLKRRIKKNSRNVYRYIEYHINSYNKPVVINILSRTKEGRDFIFELLLTQFEADADSGYNDLGQAPAVNTSNGQIIPREEIRRNLVSVDTEQVWDNNQTYFGINIGCQVMLPPYYFMLFRNI